jgi:hypothetical protein
MLASGFRAEASVPRYDDIMPLNEVKAGMKGYGLTVFRGTTIEKFDVTVVGVVKKGSLVVSGADMILVRMSGGPITTRGAYLIKGMSGSPVYINGRIIGAFSQGEPTAKESLGGVTPIEDMLEAWDPKLPDKPLSYFPESRIQVAKLPQPLRVGSRSIRTVVWNAPRDSAVRREKDTLVLHPCSTVMTVAGGSRYCREKLAAALAPYNVELVQGPGGGPMPDFKGAPLVPGAAFSMLLCAGDFSFPATGTVSYRKGDRILGFGHPFLGIGAIEAPLASAWVHDIYPLTAGSYKISSPGPVVGSSTQDRNFSVSGTLGRMPRTIPVSVEVNDITTGRSRRFRSQAVNHPNLSGAIISMAVGSGIVEVRNTPGAAIAKVETTVDAEELGRMTRSNVCFDTRGIDAAATADLDEMLAVCLNNPFYPVAVKSVGVKVEISSGRPTATVERIFLKEGRFAPGETVEVGVVLKPYKKPSETHTARLTIPPTAQSGRYMLMVRGGAIPAASFGGINLRAAGGTEQAPPVSPRQMAQRLLERERNNEFTARLVLPTTTVSVEGERMSGLPPSLDAALRSTKNSGVRLERDEVKTVVSTDYFVSGQQALMLNVQRREVNDTPSAAPPFQGGVSGGERPAGINPALLAGGDFSVTGRAADPEDVTRQLGGVPGSIEELQKQNDNPRRDPGASGAKKPTSQDRAGDKAVPNTDAPPQAQNPAPTETPVARVPLTWTQRTKADFEKGEGQGTTVDSRGSVVLTRTLTRFATTHESILWCVVGDGNGGVYTGGSPRGTVLHVSAKGEVKTVATVPELSIHALARRSDGTLYAGTGPNGRVYRITPDGSTSLLLQTDQKYVLGLTLDKDGVLYAVCGGSKGRLYRVKGAVAEQIFSAPEEHLQSVVCLPDGSVVAGASANGTVYRIRPGGEVGVLYDALDASITALAAAPNGEILVGTGPRGSIIRLSGDGSARMAAERLTAPVSGIAAAPDGTAFVSAGTSLLQLSASDTLTPLSLKADVDFMSVCLQPNGGVVGVTGNVGEVYAAPPDTPGEGVYTSAVLDARTPAKWGSLRLSGDQAPGVKVSVETRSGGSSEPDESWSAWTPARSSANGMRIESPSARFLQYRLLFHGSAGGVRAVALSYLPKNQPPKVNFAAPVGLERWSRTQTLRWEASDPDRDALTYQLFYSMDDGKSWQPLPIGTGTTVSVSTGMANMPNIPGAVVPARPKPPTMEEVEAELARAGNVPPALREAILARARQVNADFAAQAGRAQPATQTLTSAMRETSRQVDTTKLKDGIYRFKVVASDRIGNPEDPYSIEAVSEPVVICNTAPTVYIVKASIRVGSDRTVRMEGAALQTLVSISAVQFRVDGGDWMSASAADGLFDSETEPFHLTTLPLAGGAHKIEVKVFSAAGVTTTETLTVDVK